MSRRRIIRGGFQMAFQEWGPPNSPHKVLGLHGWLDNSNTFRYLGPYLGEKGFHCVAYDNIGHGHSSHDDSEYNAYSFVKNIIWCREFTESLGWDRFSVVGHSMGANLGMVLAGTYPESVRKLALIEGFGPFSLPPETAALALRSALESERSMVERRLKGPKEYESLDAAIDTKRKKLQQYPGHPQNISREAATHIISRGVTLLRDSIPGEVDAEGVLLNTQAGPVSYRHDPKLLIPAFRYFSKEQVLSFVNGIHAETLLISAEHGWSPHPVPEFLARKKILVEKLPGSHHLHLDSDTAPATAEAVVNFLSKEDSEQAQAPAQAQA